MDDLSILVSGIEFKLRKLINDNVKLKSDIAVLNNNINEQFNLIENQKKTIETLEEKIKILKVTKTLTSSKDSFDVKIKVNEALREIDKCIGLLNI